MSDKNVHIESCSIYWEGPESTLPVKKENLVELCILACVSAHPSSFAPLIMKFLTVGCVVGVNFLLLIKVLQ